MGRFVIQGIDLISDPKLSSDPRGSQGTVTLEAGTQPFPDDAVIEVLTEGETGNGELTAGSEIAGINVYASVEDYENNEVLYSYAPATPADNGGVLPGLEGVGDTYIHVDTSGLVSDDPGAPPLNHIFIAPGTDAGDHIGTLTLDRNTDQDLDGDGEIRGVPENGNNQFFPAPPDFLFICFTPSARIATLRGHRPIERLQVGDKVVTRDNGAQEIRWIGTKRLFRPGADDLEARPVRVMRGALGHRLPKRDLALSPNHRVLLAGPVAEMHFGQPEVLVAVKHLTHMPGIDPVDMPEVTYMHLLFDRHEVILSEGSWSESFQPGSVGMDALGRAQRDEIVALFPELTGQRGLSNTAARPILRAHEARAFTI